MFDDIALRRQKILRWIPFANVSLLYICQRNCVRAGVRPKHTILGVLYAFVSLLPFALFLAVCERYWPNLPPICTIPVFYLATLIMASVLIWHQQRLAQIYTNDCMVLKGHRKTWSILLAFALLVTCVLAIVFVVPLLKSQHIPDQNGPDHYELAVLTQEDILSETQSHVSSGSRFFKSGKSTNLQGKMSEVDWDNIEFSVRRFSGVKTIHATKSTGSTLKLMIQSELQSGNAELVVIVDGAYYCTVGANTTEYVVIRQALGKQVEVRLAGESAEIEVKIQRSFL